MTTVGQSLYESLRHVVESLQARFLLPSIILVIGTIFIFKIQFQFSSPEHTSLLISIVITISYLFNALNGLMIRLIEGYEFKDNYLFYYLKRMQKKKKDEVLAGIDKCEKQYSALIKYEEDILCEMLDDRYTKNQLEKIKLAKNKVKKREAELFEVKNAYFSSETLMPTAIGNIIKSFEDYPVKRYGIDAVNLWPRMFNILQKDGFFTAINNEKVTLDFLANTGFVTIIFAIEMLFAFAFLDHSFLLLMCCMISVVICYILFYSTVAVAQDWGRLVCCAFDLYRDDLRKALKLPVIADNDLEAEKKLWSEISHFIIYGEVPRKSKFKGFTYKSAENDDKETV